MCGYWRPVAGRRLALREVIQRQRHCPRRQRRPLLPLRHRYLLEQVHALAGQPPDTPRAGQIHEHMALLPGLLRLGTGPCGRLLPAMPLEMVELHLQSVRAAYGPADAGGSTESTPAFRKLSDLTNTRDGASGPPDGRSALRQMAPGTEPHRSENSSRSCSRCRMPSPPSRRSDLMPRSPAARCPGPGRRQAARGSAERPSCAAANRALPAILTVSMVTHDRVPAAATGPGRHRRRPAPPWALRQA